MQFSKSITLAAINAKWIHPSLALRLLKANLGKLEQHCRILEFALRQPMEEKVEAILAATPQILGLSIYIWNHKATLDLLKTLHEKWDRANQPCLQPGQPACPQPACARPPCPRPAYPRSKQQPCPRPWVVLGGPEVSWLPPESEIFRYADYVIRGEGEISFRELCDKLFDEKGAETAKPFGLPISTQFIEAESPDLTDPGLAFAYDLYTEEDIEQKLIYVESSRGCVFNCDFCLSSTDNYITGDKTAGSKTREFPLKPFLKEMDKLLFRLQAVSKRKQKQHTIKFLDRSFNINSERALEIFKFFLDHIDKNKNLCVHFEMVPFNIPPNMIDMLGLFPQGSLRLELGVQTINSKTAKTINRSANPDNVLEVLENLRKQTNAILHVDLIAGLPGEDIESFGKGFDQLWISMTNENPGDSETRSLQTPFEIQPGILKLLPGTPMSKHTDSFGMVYDKEPPYEIIETAAIPESEMQRIKNFARFWEILVNRNNFSDEISGFIKYGEPVFLQFMELSDQLLKHFGCNWGIAREELRNTLQHINCA